MSLRQHAGPLLLLALATCVTFGQVVSHDFVACDDGVHVTANRRLNPPSMAGVSWFWTHDYRGLYMPLSYTLFAGEATLARYTPEAGPPQLRPWVFHIGNLLLHALCAAVVYVLAMELVADRLGATFAGLVFALHPLQTETVAWISMTPGLLAALGGLIALWLYARTCQIEAGDAAALGEAPNVKRRARRTYLLATLALACALLAKPTAAAVPLMAGVLRFVWLARPWRSGWLGLGNWLALAAALAITTSRLQRAATIADVAPLASRPLIAADALSFYVQKLFVPLGLTIDYGRAPRIVLAEASHVGSWVPIAALALALLLLPVGRRVRAAALLSLVALGPVLGFIPFGFQEISTVADRYFYLAMLGPALVVAVLVARFRAVWLRSVCAAAIVVLAALSARQGQHWRDSSTLVAHGLRIHPQSVLLHGVRGEVLLSRGEPDAAIDAFAQAVDLAPARPTGYVTWGEVLLRGGRAEEAAAAFRTAIDLQPRLVAAYDGLGRVFTAQGKLAQAQEAFQTALTIRPDAAGVHNNLGETLRLADDREAALRAFQQAVELDPWLAAAHNNLGLWYFDAGQLDTAGDRLARGLAICPDDADLHNSHGVVLLQRGRWQQAADSFATALRLRPGFAAAQQNLDAIRAARP